MDGTWLTYREAADWLGVSPEAVRALARRRKWPRQTPNEIGGVARVLLPPDIDRRSPPEVSDSVTEPDRALLDGRPADAIRADQPGDRPGDRAGSVASKVKILRDRIADKDDVIADLRHRLDVADRRLDEAAEERRLVDRLRDALADATAAERIAAGEAKALRTELERRRDWGFIRRLRWAIWKT